MKSVLISVAHSCIAKGAHNAIHAADEYLISLRASIAAWRTLTGVCAVELFDCGPLRPNEYDDAKIAKVNGCKPDLAVEIHLNAGGGRYSEVLHKDGSLFGTTAAKYVAASLSDGLRPRFASADLDMRGARPNTIEKDKNLFFWLERTSCPALIVEGLFIDREAHIRWLIGQDGQASGAETYGVLVAEGIKRWAAK